MKSPSISLLAALGVASLLLLPTGCARDPEGAIPRGVLVSESSEIEQGQRAAAEVEKRMPMLDDPSLRDYVSRIGQRLTAHSPRAELTHTFSVVDLPEPNAFALPGGHIYVTRGLLALLQSEDELAGALAHEIAHVAARHSAERQVRQLPLLPVRVIAALGGAAVGIVSPALGRMVSGTANLPGELMLAGFSRSQETEADELGIEIATRAGFDARGLAGVLDGLSHYESYLGGDPGSTSFLATHPSSPSRRDDVLAHAATLQETPPVSAAGESEFRELLEGLLVGTSARAGRFEGARFAHPILGFGLTFPEGWSQHNGDTAVLGVSPDGRAMTSLSIEPEGTALAAAEGAFASEHGLDGKPTELRIAGLPALERTADLGSRREPLRGLLTWIALDDAVYRLACATERAAYATAEKTCRAFARSFARLTPEQAANVTEDRLLIVMGQAGEKPLTLAERARSPWGAEELLLYNRVPADQPLDRDRSIRIARAVRWQP